MSWHERVSDELRAREEEKAQIEAVAKKVREVKPPSPEVLSLLETFDALNTLGMVEDINKEIWQGKGEVTSTDSAYGRQISLIATVPHYETVSERFTERRFGTFTSDHGELGHSSYWYEHYGSYEQVMSRLIGHRIKEQKIHSLRINLSQEKEGTLEVADSDGLDYTTLIRKFTFLKDMVTGYQSSSPFVPLDHYPEHYHSGGWTSYSSDIKVSNTGLKIVDLFNTSNQQEAMLRVLEAGLLASSVRRSKYPISKYEQEAEESLRSIKSSIGRVHEVYGEVIPVFSLFTRRKESGGGQVEGPGGGSY